MRKDINIIKAFSFKKLLDKSGGYCIMEVRIRTQITQTTKFRNLILEG